MFYYIPIVISQLNYFPFQKKLLINIVYNNSMSGSYLCYRGNREYVMSGEVNTSLQWRVLDLAAVNDVTSDNIFSLVRHVTLYRCNGDNIIATYYSVSKDFLCSINLQRIISNQKLWF